MQTNKTLLSGYLTVWLKLKWWRENLVLCTHKNDTLKQAEAHSRW